MTSLDGWIQATESPSFIDLFKIQVDLPPDRCESHSNKRTSTQEEYLSGPSLHRLATFNINDLHLSQPTHNFAWAENVLAQYGPWHPRGWDHRDIEAAIPSFIDAEANVLDFIKSAYLGRALCAGWFLYCHSSGRNPSRCPENRALFWHDASTHSSSGRPDQTLYQLKLRRVTAEVKTDKVCRSQELDGSPAYVMDKLYEHAGNFSDGPDVSTWLKGQGTWETKGRQFLLQVWHQLLTKSSWHTMLLSQRCFMLGIRTSRTLHLSPVVGLGAVGEEGDSPEAEQARVQALSQLGFFIAHSLLATEPPPPSYGPDGYQLNSPVQTQRNTYAAGPSVSHSRSDSTQTIRPGNQGSWSGAGSRQMTLINQGMHILNTMYAKKLRTGLSFGRSVVARIRKSPFTVVFTTSGWPSRRLSLTGTCPDDSIDRWHRLIVHSNIKDSVYRGDLDGHKVVIKLAQDDVVQQLRHEMEVYKHLKDLQGQVIPICYGLFLLEDSGALLILEDCGTPLESFKDLSVNQRQRLVQYFARIHAKSIEHNDVEPRNLVVKKNNIKVIDFGLAEIGHQCHGMDSCSILQNLKDTLKL